MVTYLQCEECGKKRPASEFSWSHDVCKECVIFESKAKSAYVCVQCGVEKPATDFHRPVRGAPYCDQCREKASQEGRKWCPRCQREKLLEEFSGPYKNGQYSSYCKPCAKDYGKEQQKLIKERWEEWREEKDKQEQARAEELGLKCERCGTKKKLALCYNQKGAEVYICRPCLEMESERRRNEERERKEREVEEANQDIIERSASGLSPIWCSCCKEMKREKDFDYGVRPGRPPRAIFDEFCRECTAFIAKSDGLSKGQLWRGAIPTNYNHFLYRSRLEGRWAVFFDRMNIPFEYEMEGYILGKDWYLPDFWLPSLEMWAAVTGVKFDWGEQAKIKKLVEHTGYPCLLLLGSPAEKEYEMVATVNGKQYKFEGEETQRAVWFAKHATFGVYDHSANIVTFSKVALRNVELKNVQIEVEW